MSIDMGSFGTYTGPTFTAPVDFNAIGTNGPDVISGYGNGVAADGSWAPAPSAGGGGGASGTTVSAADGAVVTVNVAVGGSGGVKRSKWTPAAGCSAVAASTAFISGSGPQQ